MINEFKDKCKNCGVSPVIGVILLVAIVVILAAVVGLLALGFGDNLSDSSSAAVTVENGEATLVDSGRSERVIVKNNNNVQGNLTEVGDSISVSNGDVIISVSEDGTESVLREVESGLIYEDWSTTPKDGTDGWNFISGNPPNINTSKEGSSLNLTTTQDNGNGIAITNSKNNYPKVGDSLSVTYTFIDNNNNSSNFGLQLNNDFRTDLIGYVSSNSPQNPGNDPMVVWSRDASQGIEEKITLSEDLENGDSLGITVDLLSSTSIDASISVNGASVGEFNNVTATNVSKQELRFGLGTDSGSASVKISEVTG